MYNTLENDDDDEASAIGHRIPSDVGSPRRAPRPLAIRAAAYTAIGPRRPGAIRNRIG